MWINCKSITSHFGNMSGILKHINKKNITEWISSSKWCRKLHNFARTFTRTSNPFKNTSWLLSFDHRSCRGLPQNWYQPEFSEDSKLQVLVQFKLLITFQVGHKRSKSDGKWFNFTRCTQNHHKLSTKSKIKPNIQLHLLQEQFLLGGTTFFGS